MVWTAVLWNGSSIPFSPPRSRAWEPAWDLQWFTESSRATGFSEAVTLEKAGRMDIREYIMKPVLARDLGKAIRRVLEAGDSKLET